VAPESFYATVGADGLRLFHLFVGPPADDFDWTDQVVELADGCARFLDRLYRLSEQHDIKVRHETHPSDLHIRRATHKTIDKVTRDLDRWNYNTAVAALMELLNAVSKWAREPMGANDQVFDEAIDTMLLLLAPMAPHVTAELWERRHGEGAHVHLEAWPVADPNLLVDESVTMIVQVNDKVRARLAVAPNISEDDAIEAALGDPDVVRALSGARPTRIVARPPRMVNVVL
jgi:leucyl-tRNA synthetase